MTALDWDSIQEVQGFRVGDHVRYRGPQIGVIRNLIDVKGRLRARVYWPTIPFECEGALSPFGSENFVDLDRLHLEAQTVRQLGLFEAPGHNSFEG